MYRLDDNTFVGTQAEKAANNFGIGKRFVDIDTGRHYVKLFANVWLPLVGTSDPLSIADLEISNSVNFTSAMGNSTKNPTTDVPNDWVEIEINGTVYYLPAYLA